MAEAPKIPDEAETRARWGVMGGPAILFEGAA